MGISDLRASGLPLDELPAVLTVEEAAVLLRIGRGAAYEQARLYRVTDGRIGLPVVSFGRTLRVPTAALLRLLDPDTPSGSSDGGENMS